LDVSLKWVLVILIFGLSACATNNNNQMIDKTTVKSLDIQRYLGTWYEIARFQHSFEKDLVGCTATYTLKENGKIEVLNQGYYKTLDGRLKIARGKAKLTDQPGKLKVAFFLFFYAEYNVLELDQEGYQWALIGSSTPGYLWILSRKPAITDELYNDILKKAEKRGYDLTKIFKVPQ
jgi:apolipoprotein D and lipocalin family protein